MNEYEKEKFILGYDVNSGLLSLVFDQIYNKANSFEELKVFIDFYTDRLMGRNINCLSDLPKGHLQDFLAHNPFVDYYSLLDMPLEQYKMSDLAGFAWDFSNFYIRTHVCCLSVLKDLNNFYIEVLYNRKVVK